jgi:hypothetical protein
LYNIISVITMLAVPFARIPASMFDAPTAAAPLPLPPRLLMSRQWRNASVGPVCAGKLTAVAV